MKRLLFGIIISFVFGTLLSAQTQTRKKYFCDQNLSSITYEMNHPLHTWTGVNKKITAVILTNAERTKAYQVAVAAKIVGFDSDNANRDSHMIEVTEAIKYPIVTFKSSSIVPNGKLWKITGMLTFHGVSKEISFDAEKKDTKDQVVITGAFSVKLTDFKIDPPSLMGMATDDELKINFEMIFKI